MKLYVYKCQIYDNADLTLKEVEVKETPKMFVSNEYIISYTKKINRDSLDTVINKCGKLYIISFNNDINYFKELLNKYFDEKISILNDRLNRILKSKDLINKGATLLI